MYQYEENDHIYDDAYIEKLDIIEDFVKDQQVTDPTIMLDQTDVYNSTKIEGNLLAKDQVGQFLENDVTVRGVPLRDLIQIKNYNIALDAVKEELLPVTHLTEEFICGIHYMITCGELPEAGQYRDDFVHIRTTNTVPPEPGLVPELMAELIDRYNTGITDPARSKFEVICEFKRNFERIHPFFDGNGRTGRLIMNAMFLSNGYPCITIPAELRPEYFDALENNTLCSFLADRMLETMEKTLEYSIEKEQDTLEPDECEQEIE